METEFFMPTPRLKPKVIVKLNKNGKWHLTGDFAETWCGIQVGATAIEMMGNGYTVDYEFLDVFKEKVERGNKTVCKNCIQKPARC